MGASSTTVVTVIAVVLITAMVIGMLVMQTQHRNRAARREQLQSLNSQYRKLNSILRSLPPFYLSPELKDFIYQALLHNLNAQLKLNPGQKSFIESDYQKLTDERAYSRQASKTEAPAHQKLSSEEANLYRQTLKSLYMFIRRNFETGRLNKVDAEKMLFQVEVKLVETALEYFKTRGRNALSSRNYREARVAFQKAVDTIGASRHRELFKQEEIELRNQLNRTVDEWRQYRNNQSTGQSEKLASEMEDLIEDQDSWKKKNVYD